MLTKRHGELVASLLLVLRNEQTTTPVNGQP